MTSKKIKDRLEYLRGEIEAERISYGEIFELQSLVKHIEPGDVVLLEWAGVPEFPESTPTIRVFDNVGKTWDRYTVIIYQDGEADVFGMSSNADAPNGFNQWSGSLAELPGVLEALGGDTSTDIGHEVELTELPQAVKNCIGKRLAV